MPLDIESEHTLCSLECTKGHAFLNIGPQRETERAVFFNIHIYNVAKDKTTC